MTRVEPVLVERFFQRVDLCLGDLYFRLGDLGEITRSDVAGEQTDDDYHDQEFQQRESSAGNGMAGVIHLRPYKCGTQMKLYDVVLRGDKDPSQWMRIRSQAPCHLKKPFKINCEMRQAWLKTACSVV